MRDYITLIESAEGRRETFSFRNSNPPGGDIWFRLDFDSDNKLIGFEEHDHYQGGPMKKPDDVTWEEYFLQRVARRSPDEVEAAKALLQ